LAADSDVGTPIITRAEANLETMRLSIQGQNLVPTPLPKVYLGTDAGGFVQLSVLSADASHITAVLPLVRTGSYRLIGNFGPKGQLVATLDITIGTTGPKGDKGDQGEKGDSGTGSVAAIVAGPGLNASPNPITTTGTLSIAPAGVTNAMLEHPSVAITAGDGLTGGGTLPLGGTSVLSVAPGGINNSHLSNLTKFVSVIDNFGAEQFAVTNGAPSLRFGPGPTFSIVPAFDPVTHRVTFDVSNGAITNAKLQNSNITINTPPGSGLTGGGPVQLGSTITLSVGLLNPISLAPGTYLININGNAATANNFTGVLNGDVSGVQAATTISKLQGYTVSAVSPANGDVLKFNGTAWTPARDDVGTTAGGARAAGPCFDNTNRYVDCANGTVTDTVTGLIWLKQSCGLFSADWAAANQFAAGLKDGDCGPLLTDKSSPGDWRLPTRAEWEATIARAVALGCAKLLTNDAGTGCSGSHSLSGDGQFWSSSADEVTPFNAWSVIVTPSSGVDPFQLNVKSDALKVWPVRGGTR
jgi:hypothetical protein